MVPLNLLVLLEPLQRQMPGRAQGVEQPAQQDEQGQRRSLSDDPWRNHAVRNGQCRRLAPYTEPSQIFDTGVKLWGKKFGPPRGIIAAGLILEQSLLF